MVRSWFLNAYYMRMCTDMSGNRKPVAHIKAPPVYLVSVVQLASTILLAAIFLLSDKISAYSALSGGLICAIPNMYFVRKAFQYAGARAAALIVQSFFKGQLWKMFLTAVLFVLVFMKVKPLNEFVLFATFVLVHLIGVITAAKVTGIKAQ